VKAGNVPLQRGFDLGISGGDPFTLGEGHFQQTLQAALEILVCRFEGPVGESQLP